MSLTNQQKEMYTKLIKLLFDNKVYVEPYQVTEEVAKMADNMIKEIAKASEQFTKFHFKVLYAMILFPLSEFILPDYVGKTKEEIDDFVERYNKIEEWLKNLAKNYQVASCLLSARVKWRSAFELELMGI